MGSRGHEKADVQLRTIRTELSELKQQNEKLNKKFEELMASQLPAELRETIRPLGTDCTEAIEKLKGEVEKIQHRFWEMEDFPCPACADVESRIIALEKQMRETTLYMTGEITSLRDACSSLISTNSELNDTVRVWCVVQKPNIKVVQEDSKVPELPIIADVQEAAELPPTPVPPTNTVVPPSKGWLW